MDKGSSAWTSATYVGASDGVAASWLWPGPAFAIAGIWEVSQQMESLSVLLYFQINKADK